MVRRMTVDLGKKKEQMRAVVREQMRALGIPETARLVYLDEGLRTIVKTGSWYKPTDRDALFVLRDEDGHGTYYAVIQDGDKTAVGRCYTRNVIDGAVKAFADAIASEQESRIRLKAGYATAGARSPQLDTHVQPVLGSQTSLEARLGKIIPVHREVHITPLIPTITPTEIGYGHGV